MESFNNIIFIKHNIQELIGRIAHNTAPGNHFSDQFLGALLGALFAFLFFLLGEYINRKIEWNRSVNKEHAVLDRYFGDLYQIIRYNKGLLPLIINDYKKREVNIMTLTLLPIRDDTTMRMKDLIFNNKMEIYNTGIKRLNLSLDTLNMWKEKINKDLLHDSKKRRARGEAILKNFFVQADEYKKVFNYHLDQIEDLAAENRILLKKYKNWKYNVGEVKKEMQERAPLILREREIIKADKNNPIYNDYLAKMKRFGLYKDEN